MSKNLTNKMVDNRVKKMMELEAEIDALKDELEAVKEEVEAYMDDCSLDEIRTDNFVVRYKGIVSNRFDSTRFKKEHADMYDDYLKISTCRRFTHDAA